MMHLPRDGVSWKRISCAIRSKLRDDHQDFPFLGFMLAPAQAQSSHESAILVFTLSPLFSQAQCLLHFPYTSSGQSSPIPCSNDECPNTISRLRFCFWYSRLRRPFPVSFPTLHERPNHVGEIYRHERSLTLGDNFAVDGRITCRRDGGTDGIGRWEQWWRQREQRRRFTVNFL